MSNWASILLKYVAKPLFVGYWWSHVVISPDIRAPAAVICFLDHQLIPKPPNLRRYDRMCRVCIWNDAEMIIFIGLQLFESFFWHLALKNRLWRGMSWVEFTALTLFRDNLNWSELAFHGFLVICLKFISFQRLKKVAKKLKNFKVSSIFGRTVWDLPSRYARSYQVFHIFGGNQTIQIVLLRSPPP